MKQVALNIEQMNELTSLGLDTSDASMCWWNHNNWIELKAYSKQDLCETYEKPEWEHLLIPAYTLQDILEKLDKIREFEVLFNISSHTIKAKVYDFEGCEGVSKSFTKNSILKASYQMLLWCIENNYIKTNEKSKSD